jgi:hypothetical protein
MWHLQFNIYSSCGWSKNNAMLTPFVADAVGCTLKIEFVSRKVKRRASAQPGARADTTKAARRST